MLYLVIFTIILVIIILLLLFTKADIVIEYTRRNEDDSLVLSIVSLAGLLKYKHEFPIFDAGLKGLKTRKLIKEGKEEKIEGLEKILLGLGDVLKQYKSNKYILEYLKCRAVIKEYNLYLEVGTGDASTTGIISGIIWALSGIVDSYLSTNFLIKNKCVNIKPSFNEKVLTINLLCIFSVKLVHIILVAFKYIFNGFFKKIKNSRR